MASLIIVSVYVFVFFWVIRFILTLVFKRLTAHWFAVGLSASYLLGLLLYWLLAPHQIFIEAFQSGKPIVYDFAISWLVALVPLNLLVLPCLYWRDKRIALKGDSKSPRIPENALHALAFCGGLLGAYIGQQVFKHKISKQSFQIKHYIICSLSIALYLYIGYNILVT